jgi:hypothetical protein
MYDKDELYTKVVALDKIYNFVVQNVCIWNRFDAEIFDPQDFIELIPKESTCSIVTGECIVVGKDMDEETTKTKVVDPKKLWNFIVENFFIWNHLSNENYVWISHIWNSNFSNDVRWRNDQN